MGIGRKYHSVGYDCVTPGNPNPRNFEIIRYHDFKNAFVVEIRYPDCVNFEGRKILVYRANFVDFLNMKEIDPHFSDNPNTLSPIARFQPTDSGWNDAVSYARKFSPAHDVYR